MSDIHVCQKTYLADIKNLLQMQWPANRVVNIVCHGHSVPAGYFKTPIVDTFNAYPHLLHKALKERYPWAVINVIVSAIGGENSVSGAARFKQDVLTHRPDVVTIDYGLNDRRLGVEKARTSLVSMIENCILNEVKVILLTPTPDIGAILDDPQDLLNQQACLIRTLASEYQVGLVDSLAAFQSYISNAGDLKDLMAQSNHPNSKGHNLVAIELQKWFSI